jgi:K+/H+ antiporter YhaU regulatory subunit KhtT
MEKEIVGVEITNDGYRSLAGLFIVNVLDNVKSRKGWMKADACALIMEAIKIARQMDDVDYALLDAQIKKRYGVTISNNDMV